MATEKLISSDSHVMETPDLWQERMASEYGERAPRVVTEGAGDWWYVDGVKMASAARAAANPGLRFEDNQKGRIELKFAEVTPGAYVPEARVKDNDSDGILGEIIYPTIGLQMYRVADPLLLAEIFRVYNDWIVEFCAACSSNVRSIGLILLDDVETGVTELRRIRKRGLAGAMIPAVPPEAFPYSHPRYEPFWAAAQELDIPISLHLNTFRTPGKGYILSMAERSTHANQIQFSLASMIFSGVFERNPGLRVVSVEYELAWVVHFLQQIDFLYTQRSPNPGEFRFKSADLPSDVFRRHVYLSFQEDKLGMQAKDFIGVDRLMWGSDYPHPESTFPRSREILDIVLNDVPDDERAKIVFGNAAQLYALSA